MLTLVGNKCNIQTFFRIRFGQHILCADIYCKNSIIYVVPSKLAALYWYA